ncbi:MAG: RNA polymerase sigma-70 factor [Cytophagales bacterium]|nr:RNA polymerase sigma-70 factor [Cytophagales bacterium]
MTEEYLSEIIKKFEIEDDESAFEIFYNAFFPRIFDIAKYYTKSTLLAEEVVNDTFLNIWKKRKSLKTVKNIKGYLFTSTKNKSLDALKKVNKREHLLYIDQVEHELRAYISRPDEIMCSQEFLEFYVKSVDALDTKTKLIFKLVKQDMMKYAEVAELLQLSVKTVENHMCKALKQIRERIKNSEKLPVKNININ